MTPAELALTALAYGLGCLNAGYYLLRWRDGRDIRELGSGNAGARNAGRVMGPGGFALVFALDAAKGLGAVLAARCWAPDAAALCAVVVVLGHVVPVQLQGRGGKGVATALGALAALDGIVLTVLAAAFLLLRLLLRHTTAAGLLAFGCATAFALALRPMDTGFAMLALLALLAFTHRPGR